MKGREQGLEEEGPSRENNGCKVLHKKSWNKSMESKSYCDRQMGSRLYIAGQDEAMPSV